MPDLSAFRLDLEYARRGFARYAAYPAATWAGLFTNTVFGFMRVYILLALFDQRSEIGGYDRAAVVTYAWGTQALLATIYIWGWTELALRIRSGDIASDLIRPVHPLRAGLAFDLGRSAYHLIFRGLPPLLLGALVYGILTPAGPVEWLAALVSVAFAVAVSYQWRAIYNLFAFWLTDHRGTTLIAISAASILSGMYVPVRFFPEPFATIANATPFPSMVQIPIDVFMGRTAGPAVVVALATQLLWVVVLGIAGRTLFALGARKLVVQGG